MYIVTQDELSVALRSEQGATIKRELTRLGVPYFVSRGKVWTTRAALGLVAHLTLGLSGIADRTTSYPHIVLTVNGPKTRITAWN